WLGRGLAFLQKGDFAQSIPALARASDLELYDPSFPHVLGIARARSGDLEGALKAYDRALERDPRFAPSLGARGRLRAQRGEKGARQDLERYLKLAPRAADAAEVRSLLEKARE